MSKEKSKELGAVVCRVVANAQDLTMERQAEASPESVPSRQLPFEDRVTSIGALTMGCLSLATKLIDLEDWVRDLYGEKLSGCHAHTAR